MATGVLIRYLDNSGFRITLERAGRLLVFDDYEGGAGDDGALDGRDVTVFVSHRHADHFSRRIFEWRAVTRSVRYILSSDISLRPGEKGPDVITVGPAQLVQADGLTVQTFASTDEGVAFLIEADGLSLYHAGDLNWWHWEGEPDEDNREMARRYCTEIDKLRGREIDIAFLPVDPRLQGQALWGIDYFMRTVGVRLAVPMHFGGDTAVLDRLMTEPCTIPYRQRIVSLAQPGAVYRYMTAPCG